MIQVADWYTDSNTQEIISANEAAVALCTGQYGDVEHMEAQIQRSDSPAVRYTLPTTSDS